jgi:hypothetical protein
MANPQPNPNGNGLSGSILNENLIRTSVIHTNTGQEFIVTTKDKIELALNEQQKYIKIKYDWITPASVSLSVIATLVAADFKQFAGISADSWKSMFYIVGAVSIVWTAHTSFKAIKYLKKGTNKEFIEMLKNGVDN